MAKVKLIGQNARVVPLPDNPQGVEVAPGDTLETTDEHAKALARQADVWEAVAEKDDKPAHASRKKED